MLEKRNDYWYGDNHADIRDEIMRYSGDDRYMAKHFADSICLCGGKIFRLSLDDVNGVAVRYCILCEQQHPIADGDEYLEDAELETCICPCGCERFEISVGLALYDNKEDVRWFYLGGCCIECGLTACYGDWKNQFNGYKELLSRV